MGRCRLISVVVYNFGNVYNWLYYFICSSDGMYFGFLGISL